MNKKEQRLRILLEVTCTLLLWSVILYIPKAEYDFNYALMLYGFIISIIFYLALAAYWLKRKVYWKNWIVEASIYTLISSPMTFGYIVWNIQELFNIYLKT